MTALWVVGNRLSDEFGEEIIMIAGDTMSPGDSFVSANTHIHLEFQMDGNLVLLNDASVLWASGTDGTDAATCVMQSDGNLVIYDDMAVALWASATDGNPGSFLVIRNNGQLAIYNFGGSAGYAVMSIQPDWSETNPETLAWSVSVTESPLSVEQRMGLRFSPRKMLELGFTLFGTKRTYFDLLITAAGGSPIYVPLFYENHRIGSAVEIGDTVITVDTRWSELRDFKKAVLISGLFDHEVIEIFEYDDSSITLANPLANDWPAGTRLYPVMKAKIETPMSGLRHADRAMKGRMRFESLESNISTALDESSLGLFLDQPILEREPNDIEPLPYQYDRRTFNIDNSTGLQQISDVAPFGTIGYSWFVKGKQALWELRGVFYHLQGRRVPLWIPSYFADFELVENASASDTNIIIKRCGFTDTGGPFANREFVVIHMRSGLRMYRQILAAGIIGENEELTLGVGLDVDITPDSVLRISFLFFCRLDQDMVELAHHTDTVGVTTCTSVFRLDPGIEGIIRAWESGEVDPTAPGGSRPIIDPFREPDEKVWLYAPSGAVGGNDLANVVWDSTRPDADIGFTHPSLTVIDSRAVQLPDTGSMLIRYRLFFTFTFAIPQYITLSIHYENSTLEDVSGQIFQPELIAGTTITIQSARNDIITSKIDPDQPIIVRAYFQGYTPGPDSNVHPVANYPDNDNEPYHGEIGAADGDSALVVEWWR